MENKKNKIQFYKELSPFDVNRISSENFKKQLIQNNILKYDLKNETYFFKYVGLIITDREEIISVLPKCVPNSLLINEVECKEYTKDILKSIIKYNSNKVDEFVMFKFDSIEEEQYSLFSLFDYLIKDYLSYGLYLEHRDEYEVNGDSDIDWDYTLENEVAHLNKNNHPIYLNYHNLTSERDEKNIVQELHRFFLNKASLYFENLSFLGIESPKLYFYSKLNLDNNNREKFSFIVKKVLRKTFNQRKIRLLKIFLLLLDENDFSQQEDISFYGTKSFHTIWEDICKIIFDDNYSRDKKYRDIIKKYTKPKYTLNEFKATNINPLRPDVVTEIENKFIVVDAKYYNLYVQNFEDDEMSENIDTNIEKILGYLPGSYDVLKQFVYMESFFKECKVKGNSIKKDLNTENTLNIFAIPGSENKCLGKVELELFEGKEIKVLLLDLKEAISNYLKNKNILKELIHLEGIDNK